MNIVRADSDRLTSSSAKLSLSSLPPGLLEKAAARLCWIAVVCGTNTVVLYFLQRALQPEVAEMQKQLALWLTPLLVVVVSLSLAASRYFGWLSAKTSLRLGLGFEVLVGFAMALMEYSIPWDVGRPVRGISWIALWIATCNLLIPNRFLVVLATSLTTASMGPLGYLIGRMIYPYPPLPINRLLIWNLPNFLVAVVSALLSRRVYQLEIEVHRAKEMGSYQLETLLGKGGMGEVWRARHRLLARDAAIKVIRPEMLVHVTGKQASLVQRRFEQEAKTTAALRSPHSVELYDFGISEDGGFYYVMELLDGISLETLVKQFGPQTPARVVHMLRQVCESLAEAHRLGLVHRDIKPTNIFLCRMGIQYDFIKVLDFGLVKTELGEGETRMTMEGTTTGTPAYMPPELVLGNSQVDGRADLYGLGCVAYWLLTGSLVFEEKNPMKMVLAHVQNIPDPPSLKSEFFIPASLDRAIMACLAKKPEDRPASAETLARALAECKEAGAWTQDDAERWWRTNLPESAVRWAHDSQQGAVASTAS